MLIHTPKEISTSMNVKHYSLAIFLQSFPLLIVGLHLHPLRLEIAPLSTPLPPSAASNPVDALVSQLRNYCICSITDCFLRDCDFFYPTPGRIWYPLRGEGLDVFDSMVGGVEEEAADKKKTLMIGNMCDRLLAEGFAIEILYP